MSNLYHYKIVSNHPKFSTMYFHDLYEALNKRNHLDNCYGTVDIYFLLLDLKTMNAIF